MENQEEILAQVNGLKSLLRDTDHIVNEITESLVDTMQNATPLNFVSSFIAWLKSSAESYGDTIRKRSQWRIQIRELEKKMEEVK